MRWLFLAMIIFVVGCAASVHDRVNYHPSPYSHESRIRWQQTTPF